MHFAYALMYSIHCHIYSSVANIQPPRLPCPHCTIAPLHTHTFVTPQVGLSSLTTHSLSSLEDVIVRVAQSPGLLKSLRHHLSASSPHVPLFDSGQVEQDLSRAYAAMWEVEAAFPIQFHHNSTTQNPVNAFTGTTHQDDESPSPSSARKQRFHILVGGRGSSGVVQFGSPGSRHSWGTMLRT